MSVANIVMCEFKDTEGIEKFSNWYKAHGAFKDNKISLWVQTGETSAISINVYPTEDARSNADKIRDEGISTSKFRELIREQVPISGDVMITYLDGKLMDE